MPEYMRTLKIPVHHLTTKRKLSILHNLTARLTYAVQLFCKEVRRSGEIPRTRRNIRKFSDYVEEKTGLFFRFHSTG